MKSYFELIDTYIENRCIEERTGLNRLKSKMRFHCKKYFKPNVNHRVLRSRGGGCKRETTVPSTINFSIVQRERGTRWNASSFQNGENMGKFTRDYEKSDGIILTRVTSWRPRLIASREILSLRSPGWDALMRERFIMEGYERLLKVAINERR